MLRILVSGASGFIGTPLTFFLESQGHSIVRLPRDWKNEYFEGFDVVIHLAGEPLTPNRWSAEKKQKILLSRTEGTKRLVDALSANPPKLFLSASAFGYYGDRGEEILTEESKAGHGFLAHVCSEWEKSAREMGKKGCRVVQTRFGLVLGPNGGVLRNMILLYKLGLGGKLGSGKQWMSWISLHDLIRAIDYILSYESLEGPINLVSPNPVRQEEFSKTLAELLHRPSFFSIPAWALRLRLGETADELLLSSAYVRPAKLLASNFAFVYPDLRAALQRALE